MAENDDKSDPTVQYKGFEIGAFEDPEGVWYAVVKKVGGVALTAGMGRGNTVLSGMPSDTYLHAIEIGKTMVDTGRVEN